MKNIHYLSQLFIVFVIGTHTIYGEKNTENTLHDTEQVFTIEEEFLDEGLVPENQCGNTIDWQDVESYDGSLGPSIAFVNNYQGATGRLHWPTSPGMIGLCTGTLITQDTILTARHCVNGYYVIQALKNSTMKIRFDFQRTPNGNHRSYKEYTIASVIEKGNGGLDYAIVKLSQNVDSKYHPATMSSENIHKDEQLTIVQHPNGIPKVIEAGLYTRQKGNYIAYKDLDTSGGSSGAGVLNEKGKLVAVHTNAGCNQNGGANKGVSISTIKPHSPFLKTLLDGSSTNLIINPGFETITSGKPANWRAYGINTTKVADSSQKHSGNYSAKITNRSNKGKSGWTSEAIAIDHKKTLTFSGWSKASNVSSGALYALDFKVYFADGTYAWYYRDTKFSTGTHDWKKTEVTKTFDKPVVSVRPYVLLYDGTGTVWFDDVSVTAPDNLLINSGFETVTSGKLPNWRAYGINTTKVAED